jgi:heptosyltransferase III
MSAPKIAVLPASGIGDALLMMIASHQLHLAGCEVTTFHHALPQLSPWFPEHQLAMMPPRDTLIETLSSFDKIIIENDNSSTIPLLASAWDASGPKLSIFYPSYSSTKHAPLSPFDQAFLPHLCMADNIERAIAQLAGIPSTKDNGIMPPATLVHRKAAQRVVIHPTSRVLEKNWLPERFCTLAEKLKDKGYTPVFSVSPSEKKDWSWVEDKGFALPELPTLSSLAALIYESGYVIGNDSLAGHLASNLNIPALIIANDPKRMRLWQPGWHPAQCVFPPSWVPNIKFLRLREKKWQHFVSVRAALSAFKAMRKS